MSKLSSRKIIRTINKGIALNPTSITFTQIKKTIVNGAPKREPSERTIIVVIYMDDTSNQMNTDSKAEGTSYSSKKYKMIADKDADLDVTPERKIKFSSNGDNFEIKAAYPQIIEDIICGYICDLERID